MRNILRTMSMLCVLFATLILLSTNNALAQAPVTTIHQNFQSPLLPNFDYFEDTQNSYAFSDLAKLNDNDWKMAEQGNASFGFSDSQFWLRLVLENQSQTHQNLIFEVAYPLLDSVTFVARHPDGRITRLLTGDTLPFKPRHVDHPSMLFRFQMDQDTQVELFAAVKSKGSMILPVKVWQEHKFYESAATEQKVHFFYYGCLAIIMLINLAVSFTLKERLYVFYALATGGYLLFFITSRGFGLQHLFPEAPALNSQAFVSSMPILALFSLLFAREFLKTAQHSPKLDLAIRGMIYFEYFNMVAAVVLDYNTAVKISAVSAFVLFAVLFVAGPVTWAAKRRSGVFFTIAWIPLTMGFAATAGRTSGLLPNNFLTEYAMQIGSGLEAFILTLALAERLYREREKKIHAQAKNLKAEHERLETQRQLAEVMMRDPVTKLSNRSRFEWLANSTFTERPDERFVVGLTRITRLNEITRTLGLNSSELVLQKIAERMNKYAAEIDGVIAIENTHGDKEAAFRLSGDTFGVLIKQNVSEQQLRHYQSKLKELSGAIEIDSLSIELEPRFGAALFPIHGSDASQLIRNAHVAMESSRHAADQIGYYDEKEDIYSKSRLTLMTDLREALSRNETTLFYQPKQDIKSGKVIGLEALMRWQHPERGFVSPAEFIPLAEETGVINALTFWAFEQALIDLEALRNIGYEGNISINISARDLLNKSLISRFEALLQKHEADPTRIFLELTETAAMEDPEAGLHTLYKLTALGLKISIDDFGAGYSSLSYLKRLPATEIKLDMSLIKDMSRNESASIIVKTAIDMSHGLGYQVVAEGVEDKLTRNQLAELNCDKLQGFWYCKPLPLSEMKDWLKEKELS